jgi:predicted phosphoribosyltransferase
MKPGATRYPKPWLRDRREAGVMLAGYLRSYAARRDVAVLALPRGGVPVGYEVARALRAPLDAFVVRKLGVPGQEELALGAIASGGVRVLNDEVMAWAQPSPAVMEAVTRAEQAELERREAAYRGGRPMIPVEGLIVILVDDGLATGATIQAAVLAVRQLQPAQVVVAVPVGAREACARLRQVADDVICPLTPELFSAVGQWYEDFSQTSDDEVHRLLATHAQSTVRRSDA